MLGIDSARARRDSFDINFPSNLKCKLNKFSPPDRIGKKNGALPGSFLYPGLATLSPDNRKACMRVGIDFGLSSGSSRKQVINHLKGMPGLTVPNKLQQ